jgi:hypothetical protein
MTHDLVESFSLPSVGYSEGIRLREPIRLSFAALELDASGK